MKIKKWLELNKIKPYKFAIAVGFSPSFMYSVLRGEKKIGRNLAVKIEEHTKGEVTLKEIMWPELSNDEEESPNDKTKN